MAAITISVTWMGLFRPIPSQGEHTSPGSKLEFKNQSIFSGQAMFAGEQ